MTSSPASAAPTYPVQELVGGKPFGHSVKKVGDGLYVFRWWVYRNIFIITDDGVIVTDPLNAKAGKLFRSEIHKLTDIPVNYVIHSHNHYDHISDGTIFKEERTQFVSH